MSILAWLHAAYRALTRADRQARLLPALDRVLAMPPSARSLAEVEVLLGRELSCGIAIRLTPGSAGNIAPGTGMGGERRRVVEVPLQGAEQVLGSLRATRTRLPIAASDEALLRLAAGRIAPWLVHSQQVKELAAGAVRDERARLAREIHDGVAQYLAFLKMRVAWLRRLGRPVTPEQLEEIGKALDSALTETRYAISTLRADTGSVPLADALRVYAEEFGRVTGTAVTVSAHMGCPEPGAEARSELLRILQESLTNVRKHAQATSVAVDIRPAAGGIAVHIADNGTGLPEEAESAGHFGLAIMRERAESIGGHLSVESGCPGTTVRVWIPIQGQPATGIAL